MGSYSFVSNYYSVQYFLLAPLTFLSYLILYCLILSFHKILLQAKTKPKTQHVLYYRKAGALRISNMTLNGGIVTNSESQCIRGLYLFEKLVFFYKRSYQRLSFFISRPCVFFYKKGVFFIERGGFH